MGGKIQRRAQKMMFTKQMMSCLLSIYLSRRATLSETIRINDAASTDFRSKPSLHRGGAERVRTAAGQRGERPQQEVGGAAETEGGAPAERGGA